MVRGSLSAGRPLLSGVGGAVFAMGIPVAEPHSLLAAFERSHVAVVMIGADGQLLEANPAAKQLLGDGRAIDPAVVAAVAALARTTAMDESRPRTQRIGAFDCLVHRVDYRTPAGLPFVLFELVDVTDLRHRERQLLDRLERDSLTGLASRDAFFAAAAAFIEERRRAFRPLSVAMIDIDDFKAINDELGHAAGDQVLAGLAACCRESVREGDLVGRLGGDEFAALLPAATADDARSVVERIEQAIAAAAGSEALAGRTVTASFGLALHRDGEGDIGPALERADQALYAAKAAAGGKRRCG